jgi:hypothetical protein
MILTVILITFNRHLLLRKSLESLSDAILSTSGQKIEVIVADNNSTDDTPRVISAWVRKYEKQMAIKSIVREKNIGAIPSLFDAMKKAKGKYLLFLGDDDGFDPGGLRLLLDELMDGRDFSVGIESHSEAIGRKTAFFSPNQMLLEESKIFSQGSAFYKVGNSWAGIYNASEAHAFLNKFKSQAGLFQTSVWGQSSLAFWIAFNSNLPTAVFGFKYGKLTGERPFPSGGLSIANSLLGLVKAASNLVGESPVCEGVFRGLVKNWNSPVNVHLYILLQTSPISIDKSVSSIVSQSRNTLIENGVKLPIMTRALFFLVSSPKIKSLVTKIRMMSSRAKNNEEKYSKNNYE